MIALFQTLPEQTVKSLLDSEIHAQCSLFTRKKIYTTVDSLQDYSYELIPVRLSLSNNFVLQLKSDQDQVVSGFQCNLSVIFKIIRANAADFDQVGQTIGIQFRSDNFPKKNVFLYVPDDNKATHIDNLHKFSQRLGRKFILQDGFHEIYRAIKKIGKGVTASVYRALRLTDRKEIAVKSFKKDVYYAMDNGRGKVIVCFIKAAFEKEFKAMTQVDCKYVCKLISVYESENSIYIAMELLSKSLYSYLKINGLPNLNSCKQIMVKILIGIDSLHQKDIMHRDLKLENIMILERDSSIQPIIIDLGLAQKSSNAQFLYTKCGTPGYVAPEILNLKTNQMPSPPYDHFCDIFSTGVIFYILLTGKTLFEGEDEREVEKKNKECQIDYDFSSETNFTQQIKDFLRKMIQKDPTKRSSAQQLLNHPFFSQVQTIKEYQTRNTNTLIELVEDTEKESPVKI